MQTAATQRTASCDTGPRAPPANGTRDEAAGDAEHTPSVFEYGWANGAGGAEQGGSLSDAGQKPVAFGASSLGTSAAGTVDAGTGAEMEALGDGAATAAPK